MRGVLGAREDGPKDLRAIELADRESATRWAAVLRRLRARGMAAPRVAVGAGALGLWAALRDVFPTTKHPRCWHQRVWNVQDKRPKRLPVEARRRVRAMMEAETRAECERLRDADVAEVRAAGQRAAAATVRRDWEDFVTFYRFPKEHGVHLRTRNPLASVFAGVRLRTNATKRLRRRETARCLVFKLIERLRERWRALNGGANRRALVLEGAVFIDGMRQPRSDATAPRAAA